MARLPTAEELGIRTPRSSAGRVNVNVGLAGSRGEALSQIGRQLGVELDKHERRANKKELAGAELDFAKRASAIRIGFEGRTDHANFKDEYETQIKAAQQQSLSLISDKSASEAFRVKSEYTKISGAEKMSSLARRYEVDEGRAILTGQLDDTRSLVLESADPDERSGFIETGTHALQAALDKGYITEVEYDQRGKAYIKDITRGMLDLRDASGKLEMLDNDPFMNFLDADEKAVLRRKAEKAVDMEKRVAAAELRAQAVSIKESYSLQIATDPRTMDEGSFLNDSRIDDGDKATLKRSYDAAMKEDKEKFDALAAIDTRMPVNGFDTKARKGLDQAYSAMTEHLQPEQAAIHITEKTGVTPKLYVNELRSAMVSEDLGQMEKAFQSSQNLLELSPGAFAGAPGSAALIKDTRLFESLMLDRGYTSQQATQQISDARQRLKGSGGELLAAKGLRFSKDYNASHITNLFDTIGTWEPELGFSKPQKENAVADYRGMFREAYQRLGDKDLAEAEANLQLNKVYGSSDLFLDKGIVAKYAPEMFFPPIGGSHDYIRDQAATAAGSDNDKVFLVADEQTGRDVRGVMAGASHQVRYQLWKELVDGTFERVGDNYFAPDVSGATQSLNQAIKASSEKLKGRADQIMRDQEEAIHSINLGG